MKTKMWYINNEKGAFLVFELIILAAVLVVAGFAGYQYLKNTKAVNKAAIPIPHAPTPTPNPYAGWKSYTSSLEKLTFKYPSNWTPVSALQSDVPGADSFAVQSSNGVEVSWIAAADGLGGACNSTILPGTTVAADEPGPCPYWTVMDKQQLSGADLYYVDGVVTQDGTHYWPWCALQSSSGIVQSQSNIGYLMFPGKNNDYVAPDGKHYPEEAALLCGKPFGGEGAETGTKAQAEAMLSTADYQTAKHILLSVIY